MEADVRTADRWVVVPGGRVFVRSWTPRAGADQPPLVLLHDSLGCVGLWRDFPERLARRLACPVVAYDRLGFGQSSPRQELPSPDFVREEAEVYFPVIRQTLGIAKYALLGYSVGGGMALMIAALPGEPCQAVVSLSAQAFVEERTLAGIRQAREQFAQPGQFARLVRWHGDKAAWVLRAWTDLWLSPAMASWSLEPDLPGVRCPVLAIHGDQDEFGSVAFPQRIGAGVDGPAEVVLFAGCGHQPHRERPDELLDLVANFLKRSLAGGPPIELESEGS